MRARASTRRSSNWKRRESERFIRFAPTCCASGRWKRGSIRCSKSRRRTLRARCLTPHSSDGSRRFWTIRATGCAGCCGGAICRSARDRARSRAARRSSCWTGATSIRRGAIRRWSVTLRSTRSSRRSKRSANLPNSARRTTGWGRGGGRAVAEATRLEAVRGRDYDALESVLVALGGGRRWDWKGYGGGFGEAKREEVFQRRADLHARLKKFRDDAGANLAPLLRDELWPVVGIYEDLKRRAGRLDFLDLLLVARNLVRDNPAVRAELQKRFTHIFIDEFQDTD